MMLSALKGKKGVKWSHVMGYLEAHSLVDDSKDEEIPFDSPFPSGTFADDDLRKELWYDKTGDSILRLALKGAPSRIIAALCHFCPEALTAEDPSGRLPLHSACRYAVSEVGDKILQILVQAYPAALAHRDSGGRTPLHYLFWYHASDRNVEVVRLFCQKIPKSKLFKLKQIDSGDHLYPLPEIPRPADSNSTPSNAAIVSDSKHGSLPIHYAVMQGARIDIIGELLEAYPAGKHQGDRYGRTPLHWYLGAELLGENPTHVSGEDLAPTYINWWETVLDKSVLELLASSRVVRTADSTGRFPLHWACHLVARNLFDQRYKPFHEFQQTLPIDSFKIVADPHIGQIGAIDHEGKTPVMVLFDTFGKLQKEYFVEHQSMGVSLNLYTGGGPGFVPPPGLIDLLLKHPDESSTLNPAEIEDARGRLPIHAALEIASIDTLIETLIEMHPTCLIHTTEDSHSSPLHAAFASEHVAQMQTTTVISLLLNSYGAGRHGYFLDGRLAMKMDDSEGNYPIHLACLNKACVDVIRLMVEKFPKTTLVQKADYDLPLHCVMEDDIVSYLLAPRETDLPNNLENRLAAIRTKMGLLVKPLMSDTVKLQVAGRRMGMLPLHVVVLFQAIDYPMILQMLDHFPESGLIFTADTMLSLSALDMHELAKAHWMGSEDDWQRIRELIYSFGPTHESHRHREELLDNCVRIVIDEVSGAGSYHLTQCEKVEANPTQLELVQSLQSFDLSPSKSQGRIMRQLRPATVKEKLLQLNDKRLPPPPPPPPPTLKRQSQSLYDDDDAGLFDYDDVYSGTPDDDDDDDATGTSGSDDSLFSDDSEDDFSSGSSSISSGSSEDDYLSGQMTTDDEDTAGSRSGLSSSFCQSSMTGDSTLEGATTFETRATGYGTLESINEDGSLSVPIRSKSSNHTIEQVFEKAKLLAEEEKKDDEKQVEPKTPVVSNTRKKFMRLSLSNREEKALSPVALRLWTFFVLYCDKNNPGDNYVRQVDEIFNDLGFSTVEKLVSIPLPGYSLLYLSDSLSDEDIVNLSFGEVASPKCRELIRKTCYFVGRFEFSNQENSLVHWSSDRNTVVVQAHSWTFTTEETKEAAKPGVSEAEIWTTGEVPAEVGTTFQSQKSPVWIKFTKNRSSYENELLLYSQLSDEAKQCLLPLVSDYNATSMSRKDDRCYKADTCDARFRTLKLFQGTKPTTAQSVCLEDFPYAVVYDAPATDSLWSFHRQYGIESVADIRVTCKQIAEALNTLHQCNVCHGNLSFEDIVLSRSYSTNGQATQEKWVLTNLSKGFETRNGIQAGRVGSDGHPLYSSYTLPPEMFASLSPPDLKRYELYWQEVERVYRVEVNTASRSLVPDGDGRAYVVKNYFLPPESSTKELLPPLPFDTISSNFSFDTYAFGLMVFHLCAGKSLFSTDPRSQRLLDASKVVPYDTDFVLGMIYSEVQDPLAQDLLIMLLLSPPDDQRTPDMATILMHPFFCETASEDVCNLTLKRKSEATTFQRDRERNHIQQRDKAWLAKRTSKLNIWELGTLKKFFHSPTEIAKASGTGAADFRMPCSFVLLPFRLPGEAEEGSSSMERVIKLGELLIIVSKACIFAKKVNEALESHQERSKKWTTSELLAKVKVPKEGFADLQRAFADAASKHVEAFREHPFHISLRIVASFVSELFTLYDDEPTFLHLVDEFHGTILENHEPFEVPKSRRDESIRRCLLSMQLTCLFSRGLQQGIEGMAALLWLPSATGVSVAPESWRRAAVGLTHDLSRTNAVSELRVLEMALSDLNDSRHTIRDDQAFIENLIVDLDPKQELGNIERVETSQMCLWTSKTSVSSLESIAKTVSLEDLLKNA